MSNNNRNAADDFLQKQAAYYSGILDVPLQSIKYPALGANWAFNKLGLRSDENAANASQDIRGFFERPPILPDSVNNYREQLRQQQPEMGFLGNLVGSSIGVGSVKGMYGMQRVPVINKIGAGNSVGMGILSDPTPIPR